MKSISPFPIIARFGPTTDSEVDVMLTASDESGSNPIASAICRQRTAHYPRRGWPLTLDQAIYLANNMMDDADRVAMGVSDAAGRAFERAGEKLMEQCAAMIRAKQSAI